MTAGCSAFAMSSSGLSVQRIRSTRSASSASMTFLIREPRTPTKAPTQSTRGSWLVTASLLRIPGLRAMALIATVPAAISGTSCANRRATTPMSSGMGSSLGSAHFRLLFGTIRLQVEGVPGGAGRGLVLMVNDHHAVFGIPVTMNVEYDVGGVAVVFAGNLDAVELGRDSQPGRRRDRSHAQPATDPTPNDAHGRIGVLLVRLEQGAQRVPKDVVFVVEQESVGLLLPRARTFPGWVVDDEWEIPLAPPLSGGVVVVRLGTKRRDPVKAHLAGPILVGRVVVEGAEEFVVHEAASLRNEAHRRKPSLTALRGLADASACGSLIERNSSVPRGPGTGSVNPTRDHHSRQQRGPAGDEECSRLQECPPWANDRPGPAENSYRR